MPRVIILGSMPLASKVIRYLHSHHRVIIEGLICEDYSRSFPNDPFPDPCTIDTAKELGIQVTTIDAVSQRFPEGDLDFGFSCRCRTFSNGRFFRDFVRASSICTAVCFRNSVVYILQIMQLLRVQTCPEVRSIILMTELTLDQ